MSLAAGGESAEIAVERSGQFDDDSLEGQGTLAFSTDPPEMFLAMDLPTEPFEFRLVDRTLWFYNPVPAEPGWLGTDVLAFAEAAGGDPTINMDGDAFVAAVVDAVEDVLGARLDDATCTTVWSLRVRGDDLAPFVTTGGAMRRLFPDDAQTGEIAAATLRTDGDGMVSRIEVDLDDWVGAATDIPDAVISSMRIDFTIGDLDQAVVVAAPCEEPAPNQEPGQPPSLLCPGSTPRA